MLVHQVSELLGEFPFLDVGVTLIAADVEGMVPSPSNLFGKLPHQGLSVVDLRVAKKTNTHNRKEARQVNQQS